MNPKESDHFMSKSTATNDQPIPKKIDNLNYGKTNFIEKNYSTIIDIDKAIIVSDVHLGYEKSNVTAFLDFLTTNIANGTSKDRSIFILGDLWDFWRKHDTIYSKESDEVLSLINQFKDVYYLPGNHDHITLDAAQNYPDFNCYNIGKYFRIKSDDKSFFLVHGHELEVISKLTYLKLSEYDKISDQLCRMNDTEGNIASYLHEMFHRIFRQGQPQITDFLQPAEQRKGMDAIDKFAKSKARYPLLGMHLNDILIFGHTHRPYNDIQNNVVNTGAWIADMLVPKWFEEEYGQDKACFGWYIELNHGEYKLLPYGIHQKTKAEWENSESNQQENESEKGEEKENIVSKAAFQVGEVVKQMVEVGSDAVKQDSSTRSR
ncbi:MAG: UDP-2,3-diacylglucosamine diphosphatase [Nitrososphaeraceae archaeon]